MTTTESTPPTESASPGDNFELTGFLKLRSVARLLDAASLLVFVTAALYFWGYIYFGIYTERLGVPFHGISIPLEGYLIINWSLVFYLLAFVALGLFLLEAVAILVDRLARRWAVRRNLRSKRESQARLSHGYADLAAVMMIALGVLLIGVRVMEADAQKSADQIIQASLGIVIRDMEGRPIEGRFLYLRDFGSTLLVRELGPDGKTPVGHRFFKESSYSGYTLLTSVREASEPMKPQ